MEKYQIWSDNLTEADWFANLDPRLSSSTIETIQKRGKNPSVIDELVLYDRPDIILLDRGQPVLVVEKTREVPTGHNVGQRVARLIRAAEYRVPCFFFLPFDARKQGAYSSICSLNIRLVRAMLRASDIHGSLLLPVNWPADDYGTLVIDDSEDLELAGLVCETLDVHENKTAARPKAIAHRKELESDMSRRLVKYPAYDRPPTSVKVFETSEFLKRLPFDARVASERIRSRPKSMVYKMDMAPEKCKRQDPYTGMQFIYDYGWLRTGPSPAERVGNLLLHAPKVSMSEWLEANPEDYTSKSCNWYLIADGIILSDGMISIDTWPIHHDPRR